MDDLTESRRQAIARTIAAMSFDDLKSLGEGLFPHFDHPWRDSFFQFLAEHSKAQFYHAATEDRVHIIYCPEPQKGIWFLPGSAMGPLQADGLQILQDIVRAL